LKWVDLDLLEVFGISCLTAVDFRMRAISMCCIPGITLVVALVSYNRSLCSHRENSGAGIPSDPAARQQMMTRVAKVLFDHADEDGSGYIDATEARSLITKTNPGITATQVTTALQGMGLDGSQAERLSENDFTCAIREGRLGVGDTWLKWAQTQKQRGGRVSGPMQLLLFIHAPVSALMLSFFSCDNIGGAGRYFLFRDYSFECYSNMWWAFLPFTMLVIGTYTLGLPISLGVYLFKHRSSLRSPAIIQKVGFLYVRLNRGVEMWQIHEVARKLLLAGSLVFLPVKTRAATACMICTLAFGTLNYAKPHKNRLVFAIEWISFSLLTFKYIGTILFLAAEAESKSHKPTAGSADLDIDLIGGLMVALDIAFIISTVVILGVSIFIFKAGMKKAERQGASVADRTKVEPKNDTGTENGQGDPREWRATDEPAQVLDFG
jgi:hypothetical protein